MRLRVNLHDFSGHPFQVQLSRELAGRGHHVLHSYSSQFVTGRGLLDIGADDPPTLRIEGIHSRFPLIKYHPLWRTRFELGYANAWRKQLRRETFDVVVACNVPLFALARAQRYFAATGQPWVLWHQDLYSLGVTAEAARRLPGRLADFASVAVQWLECAQVRGATDVVAITEAMVDQYRTWGVTPQRSIVVPNWAPLDDIVPGPRDNRWSRAQGLPTEPLRLVYAGTLGRKHNPLLLLEILDAVKARGIDAVLIVASEGVGAYDLANAAAGRPDVRLLGFQPAESLSDMLASADAVIALLEPDAARFSVPSKVLSYMSAGRPIVALMPDSNPAAESVLAAGGYVGSPTVSGARDAAEWLEAVHAAPSGFRRIGEQAREIAEKRFGIVSIADVFERVLSDAAFGREDGPDGGRGLPARGVV